MDIEDRADLHDLIQPGCFFNMGSSRARLDETCQIND